MAKSTSVTFSEAIEKSLALATKRTQAEWISLVQARGRTLASDIACQKNLPSYNNAALDGFAFKFTPSAKHLTIKATIYAGDVVSACLGENECYKIMTGAKVPEDADTIIPFEECVRYDDTSIEIPSSVKKGNALRIKGEEAQIGSVLLQAGEVIGSREIAVLASQGISMVYVYTKLSIAVFSTGNELKAPWEVAGEDEIYDINAFSMIALLQEHGFEASYCGVIPDNLDAATRYFASMKQYDVLVTSGGVSMGEADYVERALLANGFESTFNGINIKPGKPTMMGRMGETVVASMPGNPLAAYVNAYVFLVPLLRKMQGQNNVAHQMYLAKNLAEFKIKSGRVNLVLGHFEAGTFDVFSHKYGSGMILPLKKSNALWISEEADARKAAEEVIKILLF